MALLVKLMIVSFSRDASNSEIAQLICQSLAAEREREASINAMGVEEAPTKALPKSPDPILEDDPFSENTSSQFFPGSKIQPQQPCPSYPDFIVNRSTNLNHSSHTGQNQVHQTQGPPPLHPEIDSWKKKNAALESDLQKLKEKSELKCRELQQALEDVQVKLQESEVCVKSSHRDKEHFQKLLDDANATVNLLERKYSKAKKLIKGFQTQKEPMDDIVPLLRTLRDHILTLEQKANGRSSQQHFNPSNFSSLNDLVSHFVDKPGVFEGSRLSVLLRELNPGLQLLNNSRLQCQQQPHQSPPSYQNLEEVFAQNPPSSLLDSTAAKTKADLVSRGSSLAHRHPPSSLMRRQSSSSSVEGLVDESFSSPATRRRGQGVAQGLNNQSSLPGSPAKRPVSGGSVNSDQWSADVSSASPVRQQSYHQQQSHQSQQQQHQQQRVSSSSPSLVSSPEKSSATSISDASSSTNSGPKPHILNGVHVIDWTSEHVGQWLKSLGLESHVDNFRGNGVSGQVLLQLDSSQLKVSCCFLFFVL